MNILTFDIEDWFHILDDANSPEPSRWGDFESRVDRNTDWILACLSETDQQATFFILGWIAARYPNLVRRIADEGHEIASHGYWHKLVYESSRSAYRQDVLQSRLLLEDLAGQRVTGYRAPGFSIRIGNEWAFDDLAECGYKYDSSVFPAYRQHGGAPGFHPGPAPIVLRNDFRLWELPVATIGLFRWRVGFGGGGYFRLTPLWITNYLISRLNYRGCPAVLYFHPRDFDSTQPRLRLSTMTRRFCTYVGLSRARAKLAALLRCYRFQTCSRFLEQVGVVSTASVSQTPTVPGNESALGMSRVTFDHPAISSSRRSS